VALRDGVAGRLSLAEALLRHTHGLIGKSLQPQHPHQEYLRRELQVGAEADDIPETVDVPSRIAAGILRQHLLQVAPRTHLIAGKVLGRTLIEGRSAGWPLWSVAMLVASPVVLAAFFLHQRWKTRRNLQPLLDTHLLNDRAFAIGAMLIPIFLATITPLSFSFTLLEQMGYGRSPIVSALDLAWLGGPAATSPLFARFLIRAVGVRRVLIAGAAFDLAGLLIGLVTCALKHDFLPNDLIPSLLVQGVGYGLFLTPILNAVLSGIQDHFVGATAGVLTTMQRGGNAIGMAVLEIPFAAALDHSRAAGLSNPVAYVHAFMAVAACIVVMMFVVLSLLFLMPPAPPVAPGTE
jgi:hypothetical protein